MLVVGHARRTAYAAKRALQRDTVLGSLSVSFVEYGLAGLHLDQCAAVPPAGWQNAHAVDIHEALMLQRCHAPLSTVHGLQKSNCPVFTTLVEEPVQDSSKFPPSTNVMVAGLRSVLESDTDVAPTSALALPGELMGSWCRPMVPAWLPLQYRMGR